MDDDCLRFMTAREAQWPILSHDWYQRLMVDMEERVVHQMSRVLSGELKFHLAAHELGLLPSVFLACYVRLRPEVARWRGLIGPAG